MKFLARVVALWLMIYILAAILATTATIFFAQEKVELTTPISRASITSYEPVRLVLDWHVPRVEVTIRATVADCQGNPSFGLPPECLKQHVYTGEAAGLMLASFNRANFSISSLKQRILQRLIEDKVISGVVQ